MIDNDIITDYLEDTHSVQDEYYDREIGEYHASTSGNCVRRNYYDFKRDPEPGPSAWPHFTLGNVLEDVFEDALRVRFGKRYVKNAMPIKLEFDDFHVVGETDPVIVDDSGNVDHLWEVKTTGNLKYTKDGPKQEHMYQIHCYMMALGITDDSASIVYINKYNLETQTHVVQFDHEIWMDIVDRFERLHEALLADEPPDIETEEDDQDYFCPHKDTQLCCKNAIPGED